MKDTMQKEWDMLRDNCPQLAGCREDIAAAFAMMRDCMLRDGLIMTCGNGGSAADADHIAAELMKSFKRKRPPTAGQRTALIRAFPDGGDLLADRLQRGIRTVSLAAQTALLSAVANDTSADMVFAQQIFVYGRPGDLLIALSTSGNSPNVVHACRTAKAFGVGVVGLTGEDGGALRSVCDVTIRVPSRDTHRIQEYHLPIYHALCAAAEAEMFAE